MTMRKFALFLTLLSALAIGIIPAAAAEPALGVFGLARHVPFNVSAFAAVSTSDAHLAVLDGLLARVNTLAPDFGLPAGPSGIRQALAASFNDEALADIDSALTWSSDEFGVAVNEGEDGVSQTVVIVPLVDRAAAERDFLADSPDAVPLGMLGRFTGYEISGGSRHVLFASDLLLIADGLTRADVDVLAGEDYPRLSGVTQFIEAVSALPEERYNVGLYLDARRLIEAEATLDAAVASAQAKAALDGAIAMGGTILDNQTLTLDAAFVPSQPALPPLTVNPDFARFVPGEMGASIHGADLAALINNLLDAINSSSQEDARAILGSAFGMMGLDLDSLFSWTKGDFALLARVDLSPVLPGMLTTPPNLSDLPDSVDFGLVIEAVDPDGAAAFAGSLAAVLRSSANTADNLRVRDETVNGVAVTVISIDTALDNGGAVTFEIGVGASNDVFVLGTVDAVRAVFNGAPGLPIQIAYMDSTRYWLPDATTHAVLDGATAANVLAFAGLASGTAGQPNVLQVERIVDRLTRFVRYASITTAVNDEGYTLLRAVIALGE